MTPSDAFYNGSAVSHLGLLGGGGAGGGNRGDALTGGASRFLLLV
jgi:hypothetical protein